MGRTRALRPLLPRLQATLALGVGTYAPAVSSPCWRLFRAMKVVLAQTEGYGMTAEVEIDGQALAVVDRVSAADRPCDPGPIDDPHVEVVALEFRSWERAFEDNAASEKKLEHQWGWRYLGFGEIVSVEPAAVEVDLGVLTLRIRFEGGDPDWLGEYVVIPIERIVISKLRVQR